MSDLTELPPVEHPAITKLMLIKYAAASGDFNPIHWDAETAQRMGLGGVIAHGMLSMGLLGHYVTSVTACEYTRRLSVRFRAMVRLGDVLTCRGRIRATTGRVQELEVWVENQNGEVVVSGEAEVVLAD